MKPLAQALGLALALSTVKCEGPLGPYDLQEFIFEEFKIATCKLEFLNLRNLNKVGPYDFLFVSHDDQAHVSNCGVYSLNGEFVYGHFRPPREIHYAKGCVRVLRHEFGHAILFTLNDPRWRCWEHLRLFNDNVKRYQNCPMTYLKPKECPL